MFTLQHTEAVQQKLRQEALVIHLKEELKQQTAARGSLEEIVLGCVGKVEGLISGFKNDAPAWGELVRSHFFIKLLITMCLTHLS